MRGLRFYTDLPIWFGIGLLAVLFTIVYGNAAQDDAYITYRYAHNLATGFGFSYNPPQKTFGTTTPLYTLLLAAIAWLTHVPIEQISRLVCGISLWGIGVTIYTLGRETRGVWFGLTTALVLITHPMLSLTMGMESYFLLFLFLQALYRYSRYNLHACGLLSGLVILMRYEMVFVPLLLGLHYMYKRRKVPWWLIWGALLVVLWLVYAWWEFGSPIPLSASAKLLSPRHPFLIGALTYLYLLLMNNPAIGLTLYLALLGLNGLQRTGLTITLVFAWSTIYIFLATFLAGSFPWYYAPLLPGWAFLVALGSEALLRLIWKSRWMMVRSALSLQNCAPWALLAILLLVQLWGWRSDWKKHRGGYIDNRYPAYSQAAAWLSNNAPPDSSLLTLEIGYLGYFTDLKIVDPYCLVTPELYPWVTEGSMSTFTRGLQIFQPEFVLVRQNGGEDAAVIKTGKYQDRQHFIDYVLYSLR